MPSSTARAASDATTGTETSKTPPKSARRRDLWKCGQRKRVAHSPTGEQKQKKRTFVVLPKPDKLIRYRQRGRAGVRLGFRTLASRPQAVRRATCDALGEQKHGSATSVDDLAASLISSASI